MSRLANLLYLGYYIKTTDYRSLAGFMRWVYAQYGISYPAMVVDILACTMNYATSFREYFLNRFFERDRSARSTYVGAGVMHHFTGLLNSRNGREIFRSKARFCQHFGHMMGRECLYLGERSQEEFAGWVADRPLIVAKPNFGTRGHGIGFIDTSSRQPDALYSQLVRNRQDFVEEPIKQHYALHKLHPSSVNTIRVITINTGTTVDILGAVLKCGVSGNWVDNMFVGGIAAPIDPTTGIVYRAAYSNLPWNPGYESHPDTREPILGFQVPLWDTVLELARNAARVVPSVRTVGWDIAVTSTSAILVEGNDNWSVALWQLSTGQGQLEVLRRYADV